MKSKRQVNMGKGGRVNEGNEDVGQSMKRMGTGN